MKKLAIIALSALVVTACGAGGNKTTSVDFIPQVYAQTETFTYEDFTTERYEALKGKESFAVFFHSKACGTCKGKNDEIIKEVSDFTDGTILKMEYSDAPQAMLKQYGVTKYDTFVVFNANGSFETIKGAKVDDVREKMK